MAIHEPTSRGRRRRGDVARRGTARPAHDIMSPPPSGWRGEIVGLSGINVIAGIWLIIAPWVLGYSIADPRRNDVVFGIIVGVFALIRVSGAYRDEWLSWANAVIGVWLIVAAFTIDHTAAASWNDIILGIIVVLLALGSAEATRTSFRDDAERRQWRRRVLSGRAG